MKKYPFSSRQIRSPLIGKLAIVSLFMMLSCVTFAAERHLEFTIIQRHIEKKPPTVRVNQGETLVIDWRTDEFVSVHLHGYDVLLELKPSTQEAAMPLQSMRIIANIPGRFPVSAHGFGSDAGTHATHGHQQREVPLMYLEVLPK